jgi:hypothetical protein
MNSSCWEESLFFRTHTIKEEYYFSPISVPQQFEREWYKHGAISHFSTVECLYISMRKNGQGRETLIVFLVLSTSLPNSALAVYMHPPQHLAETLLT